MSGAKYEDPRKAVVVVWQNDRLRIVRKAYGQDLQYRQFEIERLSHDALGGKRWIDYAVISETCDKIQIAFDAVLESLYAERHDKKPEPPAETEKPEVAIFACASIICQCGWVTNIQKDVWPASVVCANPNCSRFGKRYRAPVVRLECITQESRGNMADFDRRMKEFEATLPRAVLEPLQTVGKPEDGD